jgi:hypothetical protein
MGPLSIRVPVMLLHHLFLSTVPFGLMYMVLFSGTSNSIHTVRAEIDLSGQQLRVTKIVMSSFRTGI